MTEIELLNIIKNGEGISLEFKEDFPKNGSDLAKEIVAFANTQGGMLLMGVADDGQIKGINVPPDDVKRRLASFARDVCKPPINPEIEHCTIEGKVVVWVNVRKEMLPRSSDDKYYIRVGSIVKVASSDELVSMFTGNNYDVEIFRRIDAIFRNFRPENTTAIVDTGAPNTAKENIQEGEQKRISIYAEYRGVFLIHIWQPSRSRNQMADISIRLVQHHKGALSEGKIESVEYYLGPKFSHKPFIKRNPEDDFALNVSAYSPMLCLAKVNFNDGFSPLHLERYCDF